MAVTPRKKSKKIAPKTRAPKIPANQSEISPEDATNIPGTEPKVTTGSPNRPLNNGEKLFIKEYLVDRNQTQAAIRAGYSPKSAYRISRFIMKRPAVRAEIDREIELLRDKIGITVENVTNEIALMAFQDFGDFVVVDDDGTARITPLDQLKEGRSRIIKSIKQTKIVRRTPGSDSVVEEIKTEFTLHDKVKSTELLARHLGILHDKTEITGAEGGPISFTDLERATKLQRLIAMAKKRQNDLGSAKDSGNK